MQCTKCKIEKQIEDFPFKNKALNKRNTVCKVCQREYKRKHYENNKEQHYIRNEKQHAKLRDYVNDYKLDNPCKVCGETEPICLDFHHLTDKVDDVSNLKRHGSLDKLIKEIDKCVILCANCHRKLHAGLIQV